jgi:hypothetical protein
VAIVEENRHRLPEPSCRQDQIESVITVNVAGNDLQAADRGGDLKGLAGGSTELQLNPVGRAG